MVTPPPMTTPMTTPPRPWAWGNPVSQNIQHPNSNPYKIYVKSGNLSICNGCCNKFTDSDKIVVQHQEYCLFTSPKTGLPDSRFGNVYYHVSRRCIEGKLGSPLQYGDIILPESVKDKTTPSMMALNLDCHAQLR